VSADDGGRGCGPAPRCAYCGDRATALVTLDESFRSRARRGLEVVELFTFPYRLCDRCRDEVAPDELTASVLPDEDEWGRG
jgi:hypothetical protein